jgi:hypothetical protein
MTTAAAFGSLRHGQNDGPCTPMHDGGSGLLPTRADGAPAQNSRFSFERRGTEGLKSGRLPSGSIAKPSSTPGAPRARLPVWRRGRQGHGEPGSARLITPGDYATLNSYQLRDGIIDVVELDVWTREYTAAARWPRARCCGCGLEGGRASENTLQRFHGAA